MMIYGRKKRTRLFRGFTSLFLVIAMFITASLREYGPVVSRAIEDADTTYVSDIRLFYSMESQEDAERLCEDAGFTPVKDGNLNAGTSKDNVVMGYQETDDREDAITSIKFLSMDSGYDMKDYKELQKEYESSNASIIDTVVAAATEFIGNYEAGSPKALEAYEGLNLIDVPEADDMKLGDYIVSGMADWDFFAQVLARASAGTVSAIIGYLSSGLAAYENEIDPDTGETITVSWADCVQDSLVWEELEEATTEDEYDELYREYGDDAEAFHKKLQEFATFYDNALNIYDEQEYEEQLEALEGKSEDEIITEVDESGDNDRAAAYLAIYDELETHTANDDYNLGEYLIDIGHETSGDVDLTRLYPILDSMSYAQRKMATVSGVMGIAVTAHENVADETAQEKISETASKLQSLIGKDSYSVWMCKNEEIKDKKVAYTSDAIRMNAAQKIVDSQKSDDWEENAQQIADIINMALGAVFCILLVTKLVTSAIIAHSAAVLGELAAFLSMSSITYFASAISSALTGPVGWIALAVLVVSMVVIWAVSLIRKTIAENKPYEYNDEPEYVADRVKIDETDRIIFYKAVSSEQDFEDDYYSGKGVSKISEDILGTPGIGDVNGRTGFRGWNLMFYSKEAEVGSPIIIRDGECPFEIKLGDNGSN
ncbi:MAG: hypothetical protein IJM01_05795, partial [Eubacterium sp.]|nr:hypothetical protein [Eubacterium sp.]